MNRQEKKEASGLFIFLMRFSKIIILWACTVITVLMIADIYLCIQSGEQIDASSILALCGFWTAECYANAWIKVTEIKLQSLSPGTERGDSEP